MAKTSDVAASAAVPSSADIERAAAFAREPFLLDGEGPEALAPGHGPPPRPRRGAERDRRRGRVPLDRVAPRLLAAAGAGALPRRRTAEAARRRRTEPAPGRRALRDPGRADGPAAGDHRRRAPQRRRRGGRSRSRRGGRGSRSRRGRSRRRAPSADGDGELDEDEDEEDELEEEDEELAADEEPQDWEEAPADEDEEVVEEAPEDPGAARRFWFEHATGAGKTVAAVGFIEATKTGGVLILTHRRNLVDQFIGEISDRGYKERLRPPLLDGRDDPDGAITVETYQWFVRNHKKVSDAYAIVICDEAHTALGEKTSACIRAWDGPVFIGMTATGALIARHVADLFPTQTSRFDLAQAARRGVISPLRCLRIPPGPGVRTIAKVPLRKGEVDQDFDQEELAALLDQEPFNVAIADLYRSRFRKVPGVLYTAGVQHAKNVAKAFRDAGINAQAVSGETPKRELAEILAGFERGDVDVLCNAMLLAEGWNSPRATICMHLAPTASRRIYQQRVGRVTRRAPGKEAGLVIDFVHPATTHDETIITLHSLLDRDVYRGGAIVVGPVRRGRGRKVRVERRIVPVSDVEEKRMEVLEREIWRIAVENLDYPEQHAWAALAGARVNTQGWRRARAMLQNDKTKELRRRFLLTCVQRNRNAQLRLKALGEIADLGDPDAFDDAIDIVGTWSREDKRAGTKTLLQALVDKRIGRRDQAQAWVWRLASYTRELHEEYAVQRWPETKRLLGPAGQLLRAGARAQRPPARPRHPQTGPPPGGGGAGRLGLAHARGRGGAARGADADGAETLGGRPRAAAQLPQRRQAPAQARQAQRRARARTAAPREGERRARARQSGEARNRARSGRANGAKPAPQATAARSGAGEVDLAGTNGDAVAAGGDDEQVAPVVDAVGDA